MSLAERFNGEIINGDAIQMYDGLPIATNKISLQERKSIPHHLLGCISLKDRPWGVATFKHNAVKVVEEIRSRGKLPILVGGSHYYTQAVLFQDGVLEENAHAPVAKENRESTWPILGASTEEMLEELRKVDPHMAARWHPNERRKIRRSLEIYLIAGKQASAIYEEQRKRRSSPPVNQSGKSNDPKGRDHETASNTGDRAPSLPSDLLILWAHVDPSVLKPRLDARVDAMVSNGLIAEAQSLFTYLQELESSGEVIDQSTGIWVAIGYKEFLPYLTACPTTSDTKTLEDMRQEAIERTKIETRHYARRQIQWIRHKLLRALEEHYPKPRIFLLDATNDAQRACNVDAPAHDLTRGFLHGDDLPSPNSISAAAETMLATTERPELYARRCSVCDKTMMSEGEWIGHVKGRKHQSAVKPRKDWRALYPERVGKNETA